MQVSVKWKTFRVTNYILLLSSLFVIGILVKAALDQGVSYNELNTFIPLISGFSIMSLNSFFNVFMLHKYFPDKKMPKWTNYLYSLSTIVYTITIAALIFIIIIGLSEEIGSQKKENIGVIVICILFFFLVQGIFVLFCQFRVRKFLERNYQAHVKEMIENIGM